MYNLEWREYLYVPIHWKSFVVAYQSGADYLVKFPKSWFWKKIKQFFKISIAIVCLRSFVHNLFVDLALKKIGENKRHILSKVTMADDSTLLKYDELIKQVTTLEAQDGVVPQQQFPSEVCSFLALSASEQILSPED